ncbi:MAG: threonine--tRNA ligase [Christensenellales bacterium]
MEIETIRHSLAHVMAKAVCKLYNDVKLTIGPAIKDGFYYDFDLTEQLGEDDLEKIEAEMRKIINKSEKFTREEVSKEQALQLFKENPYKTELINELPDGEVISIYKTGDDFVDLCRGPHVENTSSLQNVGFKLVKVNGAYWRGNEKNKMLQRVYAYAFASKKELADYIQMQEEAKKRDHRKLGRELGLFFISDYAPGMPFFLPKGVTVMNELIAYWREMHKKAGYLEIMTPMAMNRALWEYSGHWDHYSKNMYTFKVEGEDFAIKPMNCPGGMLAYKESLHSYRDLPLRVGELGKVHRHEASGTLHGLFRVRCFTQDDAHIFMTPEQIESEVKNVLDLVDSMYSTFGLSYHLELSTMPEDHIGDVEDWVMAETKLKNALKKLGRDFVINEGDGAFYGPKIDIHIKDAIGRTWQCGTIQLDMQLPKRFSLEYTDKDGSKKEPIMIHRVIYGSIERFMGIITENFAGAFPFWLAPVQIKVLPVTDAVNEYANKVCNKLTEAGFRCELDDRNEKIGYKIRESASQKTPYNIIIGENEKNNNNISLKIRGGVQANDVNLDEFISKLKELKQTRGIDLITQF